MAALAQVLIKLFIEYCLNNGAMALHIHS